MTASFRKGSWQFLSNRLGVARTASAPSVPPGSPGKRGFLGCSGLKIPLELASRLVSRGPLIGRFVNPGAKFMALSVGFSICPAPSGLFSVSLDSKQAKRFFLGGNLLILDFVRGSKPAPSTARGGIDSKRCANRRCKAIFCKLCDLCALCGYKANSFPAAL